MSIAEAVLDVSKQWICAWNLSWRKMSVAATKSLQARNLINATELMWPRVSSTVHKLCRAYSWSALLHRFPIWTCCKLLSLNYASAYGPAAPSETIQVFDCRSYSMSLVSYRFRCRSCAAFTMQRFMLHESGLACLDCCKRNIQQKETHQEWPFFQKVWNPSRV